ncbi:MAG: HPr(Ser) kinase/phosphatase [Ignavibacteriaceae bacterium]
MIQYDDKAVWRKESITVGFLYNQGNNICKLKLYTENHDFEKLIVEQNVHRPGLALAGFVELFSFARVQVFGNTEMRYLKQLPENKVSESLDKLFNFDIPCIILTNNNKPSDILVEKAEERKIPLFGTEFSTTKLIYLISDFLDDQFAPRLTLHGSLVDVYGVGILFVGKSGIGKSEVALDLIERGHRLVADDVIVLTKKGEGILMGAGTDVGKHFMEVRGLGIIDIESMFGIRAIRYQKRLEIIVELELWDDDAHYTRTGLDDSAVRILDVEIPYVKLPILPGKNITVISEVISLNYLLKHYGHDAARIFQERLNTKIREKGDSVNRGIDYFEHDFE